MVEIGTDCKILSYDLIFLSVTSCAVHVQFSRRKFMWRQGNLVSLLFVHRLWMTTIEIYIKISLRLHKIWSKHAKLPQSLKWLLGHLVIYSKEKADECVKSGKSLDKARAYNDLVTIFADKINNRELREINMGKISLF